MPPSRKSARPSFTELVGCAGVRIGTRFVVVEETRAHPRCVEALLAAGPEDTEITELFGALWPNVPNAGLGVGNVTRIEPAPEIVRDLSSKL